MRLLTNELNLPQPFVEAASGSHERKPSRYSVTEVLGGTCEAVLKRHHSAEGDVADRVWAIFGTAVHKVLQEAQAAPEQLQENWLSVPVGEFELSGIFDLYDAKTETVTDWKTCSVWKTQVGDFEDWREQTLLYCWMLNQVGLPAWHGDIVAIMRDHSKRKAMFEKGYPKHPVLRIGWDFTEDDMARAGEHVRSWFRALSAQLRDYEEGGDEALFPCPIEKRWHKPDKWAVMRSGQKKAVRVFDDEDKAVEYMGDDKELHIEFRKGEDTKCQSYCEVARWCPHGRKFFQDSENSQMSAD